MFRLFPHPTDPHPPPQDAIFPEALKTLKEADPDVYALLQKEKLRQMYVMDDRRAIVIFVPLCPFPHAKRFLILPTG